MANDGPIPEAIEDEQVHQAVAKYITQLGLSHKATNIMLDSWEWETRRRNGTSQHQKQWGGDEDFNDPGIAYFNTATILLLSLCKNISKLYFGQLHTSAVTDYLLQVNYGTLPHAALSNLHHVELGIVEWYDHDERIYKVVEFMQHMRYFHRLPSIQTISMDGVCDVQIDSAFYVNRIGAMKKLHITRSHIRGHLLRQMLQLPKALEELTVSTGGLMRPGGGLCNIKSDDIAKALRQHRLSLKILDLSFEDLFLRSSHRTSNQDGEEHSEEYDFLEAEYDDYDEEERQEALKMSKEAYGHAYIAMDLDIQNAAVDDGMAFAYGTIGSLHDFTALTHLSISLGALLGFHLLDAGKRAQGPPNSTVRLVDVLPPNLEYLRVYDYQGGEVGYFDEQIDEFLRQRDKFPKLKEITGVDTVIEDMKRYGGELEGYEVPDRDFSWKVVS
jgi:hypothetical protein